MANLIVSAVSTFDNKGLKKGQKEISAFDKSVKTLGKTFLGVFGAQKLMQFSKNAVNAFMADEKAAKSLELQLKNTGFAFSAPAVEFYIANLQKTTGVLDDELRPAFQQLLTVTQSVTLSQDALATALNISAATGKSLQEVSAAIAKGYAGQTTGLSRLNAGLSKATLKTGNMEKIMAELNLTFAGQAAARLDTYAGKMDQLTVATSNATEIIGKGLLDALSAIGKDQSLDKFGKDLEDTATAVSYLVGGVALLVAEINKFANIKVGGGSALDVILRNLPVISAYYNAGKSASMKANAPTSNFTYSLGSGATSEISKLKEAEALKKAAKARAEELRLLNLKNNIENKNVEELKKKFDLERIGLTAALNNTTDEEIKLRLRAQLAILDNNEALAKKLLAELEAAEALKKLADAAGKLTTSFEQMLEVLRGSIRSILDSVKPEVKSLQTLINPTQENLRSSISAILESTKPAQNALQNLTNPSEENLRRTIADSLAAAKPTVDMLNLLTSGALAQRASTSGPMDVRLTIDGGSDKLSQAIAESIQLATRSGYSTVPNGFLV